MAWKKSKEKNPSKKAVIFAELFEVCSGEIFLYLVWDWEKCTNNLIYYKITRHFTLGTIFDMLVFAIYKQNESFSMFLKLVW